MQTQYRSEIEEGETTRFRLKHRYSKARRLEGRPPRAGDVADCGYVRPDIPVQPGQWGEVYCCLVCEYFHERDMGR